VRAAQSPRSGTRNPGNLSGALSLRQVSFKHAGASAPLIDRLDLEIRAGEKLAIVGRTGCGKTTLSRLMLGLLAPDTGSVCVDGVDLRELDRASLMAQMRAVLQEPFFFDRTLRENLTLGAPPVSEERLQRALHLACIDGAVAELPLGLETRMGAKGGRFSRGQLQRFSLARALISEPRILILDEATSALDLPTEAALHQNLSQLDCTRIVVAHRMQTVRDADRILVIENGAISAAGRYDDLVARPGLLHEMVSHAG
jgi:ABC-type bacteriocin/lantibiotic exporter with double-glycine peptidase domain